MRLRKPYSHFPPNIGKLRRHLDSESGELFRHVDAEGPNFLCQTSLEPFARYGKHIVDDGIVLGRSSSRNACQIATTIFAGLVDAY